MYASFSFKIISLAHPYRFPCILMSMQGIFVTVCGTVCRLCHRLSQIWISSCLHQQKLYNLLLVNNKIPLLLRLISIHTTYIIAGWLYNVMLFSCSCTLTVVSSRQYSDLKSMLTVSTRRTFHIYFLQKVISQVQVTLDLYIVPDWTRH